VGIIGVVGGNFLTVPLSKTFEAANLLVMWAGLVLVSFLAMYNLRRKIDSSQLVKQKRKGERSRDRDDEGGMWSRLKLGYTFIRYYPIIGLLALAIALTFVLYYILWHFFLEAATLQYTNSEDLAGYLGIVNGSATIIASVFSLFLANRLFSRFGIRNMLLVLPLTDLLSFGLMIVGAGAGKPLPGTAYANIITGTRFGQMVVKEGLYNSATQTLYNLIPAETREVATTFNQAVSQQAGVAIAGLVLLVVVPLGNGPLLVLGLVLSVVYFGISWRMRSQYRPTLVQLLKEGQQDFFSGEDDERGFSVEISSPGDDPLTIAITNLQDANEGTRRLSAELLGKIGASEGIDPLIRALMMDASPEVRRTAIVSLKELSSSQALSTIAEAMTDMDAGVRAEAAFALRDVNLHVNKGQPDPTAFYFLRKGLQDNSPIVRREAALTMANFGRKGEALWILWEMGRSNDSAIRREAAAAYGMLGDKVLVRELVEMLDDADPMVRRQAVASLSRLPGRKTIEALLLTLQDDNQGVREEAAHSLATMRMQAGRTVLQYLFNTNNPKGQAAALHALSLAKIQEQQDANALRWTERSNGQSLLDTGNGAADAAGSRLSLTNPLRDGVGFDLTLEDENRLLNYGRKQIELARRLVGYIHILKALNLPPVSQDDPLLLARRARRNPDNLLLLNRSLQERYDAAILRAVGIVGLLGNVEAIDLVANGLQAQGRNAARMRADAVETLENLGDPRLTPDLIALLERQEGNGRAIVGRPLSEILIEIWLEGDEWLRACVLHVIGMFDLRRLSPLIEQVLESEIGEEEEHDPWVEEAAMEAQQRLEWPHDDYELNIMLERSLSEKDMQTLGTLSTMSRILFLQKVPIFANLSPEDLRRVALVSRERLFSPNEIVCYEGDPGDELYIVVSGRVQVLLGYGEAGAKTLSVASEGQALGEIAILDDVPRTATLRAYGGPVRLLTLSADEFKRILRERPELAVEVIRVLSRLISETNKRLQSTPNALDNVTQAQRLATPGPGSKAGQRT